MSRALLSFLLPLLWLAGFILYHTSVYSTFKVQNKEYCLTCFLITGCLPWDLFLQITSSLGPMMADVCGTKCRMRPDLMVLLNEAPCLISGSRLGAKRQSEVMRGWFGWCSLVHEKSKE